MEVEQLRAFLQFARINPLDLNAVAAFGEGYLDRLRSELRALGQTQAVPAIAQPPQAGLS